MITVTSQIADLDIAVVALYRFAGAEQRNQPQRAGRAAILATELAEALNEVDPSGERPCRHQHHDGPAVLTVREVETNGRDARTLPLHPCPGNRLLARKVLRLRLEMSV